MQEEMLLKLNSQAIWRTFGEKWIKLSQDTLALHSGLGLQIKIILQPIHMLWRCRDNDGSSARV